MMARSATPADDALNARRIIFRTNSFFTRFFFNNSEKLYNFWAKKLFVTALPNTSQSPPPPVSGSCGGICYIPRRSARPSSGGNASSIGTGSARQWDPANGGCITVQAPPSHMLLI